MSNNGSGNPKSKHLNFWSLLNIAGATAMKLSLKFKAKYEQIFTAYIYIIYSPEKHALSSAKQSAVLSCTTNICNTQLTCNSLHCVVIIDH